MNVPGHAPLDVLKDLADLTEETLNAYKPKKAFEQFKAILLHKLSEYDPYEEEFVWEIQYEYIVTMCVKGGLGKVLYTSRV